MTRIQTRLPRAAVATSLFLALALGAAASAADTEGRVIPLPPDVAKDLAAFGEGVVGKALPAPTFDDVKPYMNIVPGVWEYEILAGGKEGQKVRTESYKKMPDENGGEVWSRALGTEYVEYMTILADGGFTKHLEDDVDLGYTSRFVPGPLWHAGAKPGSTIEAKSKIEAFKTAKPDHISYRGEMKSKLSYIGAYEVKTPAGTFPAILVKTDFDIKIGPADVSDVMYAFYAKGVGKVAEIESTRVSAVLIYHSTTKVVKVLKSYPKH